LRIRYICLRIKLLNLIIEWISALRNVILASRAIY